jgi:hypothetical protein
MPTVLASTVSTSITIYCWYMYLSFQIAAYSSVETSLSESASICGEIVCGVPFDFGRDLFRGNFRPLFMFVLRCGDAA